MKRLRLYTNLLPYLFLTAVTLGSMLLLALQGLNLGFFGDVLALEYHYQTLGIRRGMNWLVTQDLQRHLLGALYSAPVHALFPGQSAAWYATALLTHFAAGFGFMLFIDTLLRGRWRWLSCAAALVFLFSTIYVVDSFEFPTNSVRNVAALLVFLSLWAYVRYWRSQRRVWLYFSLVSYVVAFMSYEQSAFFFILYPLLAYFEKPPGKWRSWLLAVAADTTLYAVFVVIYLFILTELFPTGARVTLSPSYLVRQLIDGINLLFNPLLVWTRAAPAMQGTALFVTLVLAIAVLLVIAWGAMHEQPLLADAARFILVGLVLVFANLLSVAPTSYSVVDNPRVLYLSVAGAALLVFGVILWLVKPRVLRAVVAGALAAMLIAPGIVETFQIRQNFAQMNDQRQIVLSALAKVVKLNSQAEKPYILLVSDAEPSLDLGLSAQDINFPSMIDMALGTVGVGADALYFDVPAEKAPPANEAAASYIGPYIIVDQQGIYSPLRPGTAINPDRLVIVYYDSATKTARILDQLPPDLLSRANIIQRVSIPGARTANCLLQEDEKVGCLSVWGVLEGFQLAFDDLTFASG